MCGGSMHEVMNFKSKDDVQYIENYVHYVFHTFNASND